VAIRAITAVAFFAGVMQPLGAAEVVTTPDPIYRLRITLRTSALEATLRVRRPAVLIQGTVRSARGEARADWGSFGRGPLEVVRRRSAASAAAVFVVAVTPSGPARLRFTAGQEGPGRTTIKVGNLNERPAVPIAAVRGPGRFRVRLAAVAARGPVPGTAPLPPSALAFYYPWYQPDDWAGGKPIAPYNQISEPYHSSDAAVIDRHVAQARTAGLDGFLVSWWGRESSYEPNVLALTERIPPDLTFALYVELFSDAFRTEADLIEELDYALDTYAGSDRYLRIGGRPALYAFSTHNVLMPHGGGHHPDYEGVWSRVRAALAAEGHDPVLIGEGRPFTTSDFGVFDGMHVYGTTDPSTTAALNREMALTARAWAAVHGGTRRIWAASVLPGYDDRHISGRKPDHFLRQDGHLYADQWDAAIASHSDQVLVVSFNEWMETTNIEPNVEWGNLYLDLTSSLASRYRASR
jgi:Glycosyl hydrolase family 99